MHPQAVRRSAAFFRLRQWWRATDAANRADAVFGVVVVAGYALVCLLLAVQG